MPYQSRKVRGKNCYRVYNKNSKKVFAKCTSKRNSVKQLRLLRAIENNKNFVTYSSMKKSMVKSMKKKATKRNTINRRKTMKNKK
jgi:hypothetical protein